MTPESAALLGGVRVLQVGSDPFLAETTRLLDSLGANVATLADGPGSDGSRWREAGKRPISRVEAQRGEWDILVAVSGRDTVDLSAKATSIVPATTLDPFRREAQLAASSGIAALSGESHGPPMSPPYGVVTGVVGAHAAVGALSALIVAERDRSPEKVSISDLRSTMAAISPFLAAVAYSGLPIPRPGNRSLGLTPGSVLPCADGFIGVGVASDDDWELLARLSGRLELEAPALATRDGRRQHQDEIQQILRPWLASLTRAALFDAAQMWRLPFAPALTVAETIADPHFAARHSILNPDAQHNLGPRPAGPFRFMASQATSVSANRVWRRDGGDPPLAGLRVLDLSSVWSGPYAGRLLAVLGADVVKIEAPDRPDGTRGSRTPTVDSFHLYADATPGAHPLDRRADFNDLNRGKRGILIDLDKAAGRSEFLRLLADCDLVVDNYSPRVLPNFNLDPRELLDRYPHLGWISMPAFGLYGPYRDRVALGSGLELVTGLAWLAGQTYGNLTPHILGTPITDCVAGCHAALAALALIWRTSRGRGGGHVELAQVESALQLIGTALDVYPSTLPQLDISECDVQSPSDLLGQPETNPSFVEVFHPRAGRRFHLRSPWQFLRTTLIESVPAPMFGETEA